MKKLLFLLLLSLPCLSHAQGAYFGTGSAVLNPSVVQFTSGATNCGASSQNPSTGCALSNTASGNNLWALAIDGGQNATTWNLPTTTGTGCSGVTWTLKGTSNATAAAWESTATSAGACTVTLSASSSAGGGFVGIVYEVNNGATLNGTPGIGTLSTSCSSCTGASTTTTLTNALLLTFAGSAGNVTIGSCTVPATTDAFENKTNAGPYIVGCHGLQASAATYQLAWTTNNNVNWYSSILAITP